MSRAREVANFDPALFAADEVSLDKVSGGTIGAGTLGSAVVFPAGHVIGQSFNSYQTEATLPSSFPNTKQGLSVSHTCKGNNSQFLVIVALQILLQQGTTSETAAVFTKIMAQTPSGTAYDFSGNFRSTRRYFTTATTEQIGANSSVVYRGTVNASTTDSVGSVIEFWPQSYVVGGGAVAWLHQEGQGSTIQIIEFQS